MKAKGKRSWREFNHGIGEEMTSKPFYLVKNYSDYDLLVVSLICLFLGFMFALFLAGAIQ